ncbi:acyltransferase family protein [Streptomyces dysideae]|uniref:Acyltransferase 3 domain-containing protein n=1 Tax=Streptomyces dysideae TaxID=909626 RepID=A0A117RYM1_9ACTN|nr:acyltransferase family protein [Streptomyces dysideae]KUO16747.1 hypothetical protein AQJ91_33795 [Streptomyces dysideae]
MQESPWETEQPTRTTRQLTYIAAARLLPSFCILASHLSFEKVFKDPGVQDVYYRIFNPSGFNAVSFFIVLSGFILTWISANRPPDRGFVARRLLRILPVHFLTWAVVVCAFGTMTGGRSPSWFAPDPLPTAAASRPPEQSSTTTPPRSSSDLRLWDLHRKRTQRPGHQ